MCFRRCQRVVAAARHPRIRWARVVLIALLLGAWSCASGSVSVLARGILPYAVASAGPQIVSVELSERFELVVRDGSTVRRVDLGPPEVDMRALAIHQSSAYVGSDAGFIHEIDLTTLRLSRSFAVGSAVLALAVDSRYLLSADASGAVCLRRRDDAALLQCALPGVAVSGMQIRAATLWLLSPLHGGTATEQSQGGRSVAIPWSLPSLRPEIPTMSEKLAAQPRWRGGTVWARGHQLMWARAGERRILMQFATAIRSLEVTDTGALIVAAWPKTLDDPALVMIRR